MNSSWTNSRKQGGSNIFDAGARFGSTKVAGAILRGALILAAIAALVLITATPAQGQTETVVGSKVRRPTETVLYNFCSQPNCSDGANPESSLTSDGAGNFYGTTADGGLYGFGTVFELSPNGSGGWNESVLYSFTGGSDGAYPNFSNVIFDSVENLYGTTYEGGANGSGVVFELSPVVGSWRETVLYSFCSQSGCTDGANPEHGVIMDRAGNIYGVTQGGAVFELSPSGSGWTEQVIYTVPRGGSPEPSGLTMDASGNIFGAGLFISIVFELSPDGNGGWNSSVIYNFPNHKGKFPKGEGPTGTLVLDQAGNLYGMTFDGGDFKCNAPYGCGTVYELSPGYGTWTGRVLHSFRGGKDGNRPLAGVVLDAAGNIYGTTNLGGGDGCVNGYGCGTVFELVPDGAKYKQKILWSFRGYRIDGSNPWASVILDSAGNLYGTTNCGGDDYTQGGCGSGGNGIVFEVTP